MILHPTPQETKEVARFPKIDIETLLKTKIAPLPGTALRLLELLRNVNVSTRALATEVGYDPLLTTRILRLANSSFYALQRNVTSIQQAIEKVGTRSLYDMVMVGMMINNFSKEIRSSVLGRIIWEHSLVVAFLSRELSKSLNMRGADDAFICGLLHDIGKIILLKLDVERYSKLLEIKGENEMLTEERNLFGYDHAQIGGLIASRWGLPEGVSQAIMNHHSASDSNHSVVVSHIINIADILANVNGYGMRLEDESVLSYAEAVIVLNLTPEKLTQTWNKVHEGLSEVLDAYC